jgi:two-component system response regulator AtoC
LRESTRARDNAATIGRTGRADVEELRMSRGHILVVDDDDAMRRSLHEDLVDLGFTCENVASIALARQALDAADIDAVVTDVRLAGEDGVRFCASLNSTRPEIPVVVMTAFGTIEAAVDALRAGAFDFVSKPFDVEVLAFALDRAMKTRRLEREVKRLSTSPSRATVLPGVIGESRALKEAVSIVERVADTDVSVLLTGETGTGKEVFARALHTRSRRANAPFVAVNCAAVPEALLESQLFGHQKGAFTDAKQASPGLFVEAGGGTLFLDEIGHMPLALQPKLLRALQERVVRPLGGRTEVPVDVRLITATHVDLEEACETGLFRADLYYRINVVQIDLPPLRARENDVLQLAHHLLDAARARLQKDVKGIAPPAALKLLSYPWPGNVRELANCIERAVALARFDIIQVDDLPDRVRDFASRAEMLVSANDPSELVTLDEMERRYIHHVFRACGENRMQTARVLGIDRKTLYRKLKVQERPGDVVENLR